MKNDFIPKIKQIISKFQLVSNSARQDCMARAISGMIASRSVQQHKIAEYMNEEVEDSSNEIRLQDFFREVSIDYDQVALLLSSFFPSRGKLYLILDRTQWQFGKRKINILMAMISYGQMQLPIYWELLDNKGGCSSTSQRIDIVNKCIALLGVDRIAAVIADTEFVGRQWMDYLKSAGIAFCIRVPYDQSITCPQGCHYHSDIDFADANFRRIYFPNAQVYECEGNVLVEQLKGDEPDTLFLFGQFPAQYLRYIYKERWRIETFFQAIKGRGFNTEDTHVKLLDRLKKLLAIICLAYACCLGVGIYFHEHIEPIKKKNHGYKANSFFRHGLNQIKQLFKKQKKRESWQQYQLRIQQAQAYLNKWFCWLSRIYKINLARSYR